MLQSFKFKIVFRVLLLTATLVLLAWCIFKTDFIFVTVSVAALGACQVFSLIYFAEKTNRDLSRFLLSIKYDDTSQAFTSKGLGTSFNELKEAFSQVISKLKETRSEKEVHARYLDTIIQHVNTGLIVYRPDGTVELVNNAAKKLLRSGVLRNIKRLRHRAEPFPPDPAPAG